MSGFKKSKPFHDLKAVKAKFASLKTAEFTSSAATAAWEAGFSIEDVADAIQALHPADFSSSAPSDNPPNPACWHDAYSTIFQGRQLYLKFAGESIADVRLTSFKDAR